MITEYYEVTLFSPGARTHDLSDSLRTTSRSGELDLLALRLSATTCYVEGVYTLNVKESLRKEKRKYEREEYQYKFQVKRE